MNALERIALLSTAVDTVGQIYSYADVRKHVDKVIKGNSRKTLLEKGYQSELDIAKQYIECPDGFRMALFDDNVAACLCYYKWSLGRVSYTFSDAVDQQISQEIDWKHLPFDSFFISTTTAGFIVNRLRSFSGREQIQIVDCCREPVSIVYGADEVPDRVKQYICRLQEMNRKPVKNPGKHPAWTHKNSMVAACRNGNDVLTTKSIRTRVLQTSVYHGSSSELGKPGSPKAPHVRRGHYQRFWRGSGSEKEQVTRWVEPMMIHAEAGYIQPSAVSVM